MVYIVVIEDQFSKRGVTSAFAQIAEKLIHVNVSVRQVQLDELIRLGQVLEQLL
jgi:hypothetical protein